MRCVCSYNFVVSYRDEHVDTENIVNERHIFTEDIDNSELIIIVVGNDFGTRGGISKNERTVRLK